MKGLCGYRETKREKFSRGTPRRLEDNCTYRSVFIVFNCLTPQHYVLCTPSLYCTSNWTDPVFSVANFDFLVDPLGAGICGRPFNVSTDSILLFPLPA
jgi:hypothetical protein